MSQKNYVFMGEPIPPLTRQTHAAFLLLLQEAVLYSLEKQNLLTATQRDQCIAELETRARNAGRASRRKKSGSP